MNLKKTGEFGLIRRIRQWMPPSDPALIQGIGDDVAVIGMGRKALLATTDILIEGVHFDRLWADPFRLGRKALLVNISDIAAMGGTPRYFLISLGLPQDVGLPFISLFYRGLRDGAKRYHVDLIGGDTSRSGAITINICLLGEGEKGSLLFRSGSGAGDDLFVSGTLGDSALGLEILRKEGLKGKPKGLIQRHLSPSPRIALGQAISKHGWATAMIDVSDGLLIDTCHLLEESGVGARIWKDRIPLSGLYRKYVRKYSGNLHELALSGGEDYELLFTAPPRNREKILALGPSLDVPISRIGEILPVRDGFRIVEKDGKEYLPKRLGFDHFR